MKVVLAIDDSNFSEAAAQKILPADAARQHGGAHRACSATGRIK